MDTQGARKEEDGREEELRALALKRLKKQADFRVHLTIYVAVNLFLVGVWWFTGAGYFWPIFPMLGWGIGVVANAWDVFKREHPTEEQIRREMDRLR